MLQKSPAGSTFVRRQTTAFLTPSSHTPKDKLRVSGKTFVRTPTKPLHNTGTKSFYERVCGLYKPQHNLNPFRIFKIEYRISA